MSDPDIFPRGEPPAAAQPANDGLTLIAAERARQQSDEGWTPEHDDVHRDNELIQAARAYVWAARQAAIPLKSERLDFDEAVQPTSEWNGHVSEPGSFAWPVSAWPWEIAWWKPSDDPIRNLVKAGGLIAAEIDRLQRVNGTRVAPAAALPARKDDLAWRLGCMAEAVLSAKVGAQARFFTRATVDEIVLLLREAEKRISKGR